MRSYLVTAVLVVLALIACGQFGMAAAENCQPGTGLVANIWYSDTSGDLTSDNGAYITSDILLAGDSDRGCCILKTSQAKCVYTNKAFCERKARQANITFDFHKGVECKKISACK